ncbi:MAG: RNA methyltransferase [Ferruginibacter sp.]|nr:RNA methyltransferase [Ferruginibacter sp.]
MLSKSVIKYIQSLQQKKFRDEHKVFVAEGTKVVGDLIKHNAFQLQAVYCLSSFYFKYKEMLPEDQVHLINEQELEKIAHLHTPNEVVAIFYQCSVQQVKEISGSITLLLDDIRDPGNLGTIIRTADWFGIKNIVCSKSCVEMYNPKVVQSTMASLGNVNILYTNLEEWIKQHPNIPLYAATLYGESLNEKTAVKEALLLIGNESKGISSSLIPLVHHPVMIKGFGNAESLNAAIAAGILIYSFQQRLI